MVVTLGGELAGQGRSLRKTSGFLWRTAYQQRPGGGFLLAFYEYDERLDSPALEERCAARHARMLQCRRGPQALWVGSLEEFEEELPNIPGLPFKCEVHQLSGSTLVVAKIGIFDEPTPRWAVVVEAIDRYLGKWGCAALIGGSGPVAPDDLAPRSAEVTLVVSALRRKLPGPALNLFHEEWMRDLRGETDFFCLSIASSSSVLILQFGDFFLQGFIFFQ